MQTWRGTEVVREMIDGSHGQQYLDLPMYIEKIRRTNPGTEVRIHTDEGRFKQLFIAYQPCIMGFINGCRPLIGIDGIFLKGKYQGILLCAITVDANNELFPLAFAVVEKENYQNWYWFLSILSELLNGYPNLSALTIISDRQKSLSEAIEKYFPTCLPSFCMRYMGENFKGFIKSGIPCAHAIAAINHMHMNPTVYCLQYFTVAYFRRAFETPFAPVPDDIEWTGIYNWTVLQPRTTRLLGRPKKQRRISEAKHLITRPLKCKQCDFEVQTMRRKWS
ncbi:hypothetical protein AMTR_s00023p00214690 [Amborella trichopoda]|uniref:MULE transposase domain-containing protein n=1 Tax=Amborella trichopoda TaxID=13333 RepID=W1NIW1_AMBTC|nr:hypothetical protein AMTR_s00023p00214690 [Amborella trichopoda]